MTSARGADPGTDYAKPCLAEAVDEVVLVYDWECPVCDIYCRLVRVRPTVGRLRLVNARESTILLQEITRARLDIDQGMIVKMGRQLYYGSDAIHALALISDRANLFNRLIYYIFRSSQLSRILYPALRMCRNLLLKIMGKTKINNLKIEANVRF
jgi:predicted DCC family thiol-disulfide oxidoreductase YuxK